MWDAGLAAIAQIDAIVRDEEIACDFEWVPGYLHAPLGEPERRAVAKHSARKRRWPPSSGFDAAFVDEVPFVGGPGVALRRIRRAFIRASICRRSRARSESRRAHLRAQPRPRSSRDEPLSVKANGHTITCDDIVLATHNP